MGLLIGDPHPYAYVTRKGNADTIGRWTMEQSDGLKIYDGLCALSARMGSTRNNKEAQKAMEWFLLIVDKIEDWPADRVLPTESSDLVTVSKLIQRVFFNTGFYAYGNPVAEELLHRLRPNEKHAQWLEEWERNLANLERSRQEARDRAAGMPLKPLNQGK